MNATKFNNGLVHVSFYTAMAHTQLQEQAA